MLTVSSQQLSSSPVSAQAQTTTTLSFRTTEPASGGGECAGTTDARLTLQGQGTLDSNNIKHGMITGGTFQITNSSSSDGQILYSGSIDSGQFLNDSSGVGTLNLDSTLEHVSNTKCGNIGNDMAIVTSCDTSDATILLGYSGTFGIFNGKVECSSSSSSQGGGRDTTTQSSSMATGSSQEQDDDSDGIRDSSDRCTHNSNPRCFKEGDANTTTTSTQQQPPSSLTAGSSQGTERDSGSSNSNDSNNGSSSSNSKDGDRDGVPDSSDKCTHTSNPKCFKEGDTSNTTTSSTTQQQQEQSSSSMTGNQTRDR